MVKVLLVHNRYRRVGGEDTVFSAESRILRRHGVAVFKYIEQTKDEGGFAKVGLALNALWSRRAYRRMTDFVRRVRPDVVHFHNFFPVISPSAHWACKAEGVPVVQTLHNYRIVCPNAISLRANTPCRACVRRSFAWPAILHACYHHGRLATIAVATMLAVHRVLGTWSRAVDLYIAPTKFVKHQLVAGGLPDERIAVKPHFVHPDPGVGPHEGGFALFVGRLSPEKGVHTLCRAWDILRTTPLKIVGTGPLEPEVRGWADRSGGNIEYLGHLPSQRVTELMREAYALILPSVWYEIFGLVAVEAFATGLPVIASRIGSLEELVTHGETGLHFTAGDAEDLAGKVRWAFSHPRALREMGRRARETYEHCYGAERNYTMLMDIYRRAMSAGSGTDVC